MSAASRTVSPTLTSDNCQYLAGCSATPSFDRGPRGRAGPRHPSRASSMGGCHDDNRSSERPEGHHSAQQSGQDAARRAAARGAGRDRPAVAGRRHGYAYRPVRSADYGDPGALIIKVCGNLGTPHPDVWRPAARPAMCCPPRRWGSAVRGRRGRREPVHRRGGGAGVSGVVEGWGGVGVCVEPGCLLTAQMATMTCRGRSLRWHYDDRP